MTAQEIAAKIEQAGFSAKIWSKGETTRIYVRDGSRDMGYLLESDDGGTGTCKHITRRAGYIAEILRS